MPKLAVKNYFYIVRVRKKLSVEIENINATSLKKD
jgi:hypothetical protein